VGTTPEANYEHRFAVAAAGPDSVYVAGDTLVKRTTTCTIERVSLK